MVRVTKSVLDSLSSSWRGLGRDWPASDSSALGSGPVMYRCTVTVVGRPRQPAPCSTGTVEG